MLVNVEYFSGAQLNNNQEFQDITGIKPVLLPIQPQIPQPESRQENVGDISSSIEDNITTNRPHGLRSSLNLDDDDDDTGDEDSDEEPFSGPLKQYKFLDEGPVETIRFDKPFYWYLQDEVLGPVYVGIVNSFKTYKDQVASIEDGFDDMFKYQFWSCSNKHLALIDMFKSPLLPANNDNHNAHIHGDGEEEDD